MNDTTIPISSGLKTIRYAEDGKIKQVQLKPNSPDLQTTEQLLWNYDIKKGFLRKKITTKLIITNYRILKIDVENNSVNTILMSELDDVVVINSHRVSENVGYSVYAGSFGGRSMGFGGPRFSKGKSKIVGDVVFIVNGQKTTWSELPDPNGLRSFIRAIKKHMYDELIKLEKKQSKPKKKIRSGTDCINCGKNNPKRAKFCNGCGAKLATICTNCKKDNPIDSSFCNHCGFTLQ